MLNKTNPRAYANVYLGEVTGTGGQVFDNLILEGISDGLMDTFDRFECGLDFGFAVDPDALVECHYDRKYRILYITKEFYGIKNTVDNLAKFAYSIVGKHSIIADSAEPRMISELRRHGLNVSPAKKGTGSVDHGIRWLSELSAIQIDPERTPNTAREFSMFEYRKDRFGNFLAEYSDKDNHCIDAVRYAVEAISTERIAITLKKSMFGI
ncbi:hypothetical protein AGMMS49992_26000 [Clostridia bacterium]|nr:hypothetical protein AGMMS49992_26000 [Clostridia bacterium]